MRAKLFDIPAQCCGCGACAAVCPASCITMETDKEGFLYPAIHRDKCISCEKCRKVCPLKDTRQPPVNKEAYALDHNDEAYRWSCTSAGAFEVICRSFCGEEPCAIFGVVIDENKQVKHCKIEDVHALQSLRKSKYVQSYLGDTFYQVKQSLQNGKRVVFSGSPCQVDGLRHYLNREYENLFLVDFVCHGVPSQKVFDACIEELEEKHRSKITQVLFRNKVLCDDGWNCLGMQYLFENGDTRTELYPPCTYMTGFLSELYLRPSCHACKYASMRRVSDITLGDSWGMDAFDPRLSMRVTNGTSLVMLNTNKGRSLLSRDAQEYTLRNVPIELLPHAQKQLVEPSQPHRCRNRFFALLPLLPFSQAVEIAMHKNRLVFYKTLLRGWLSRLTRGK